MNLPFLIVVLLGSILLSCSKGEEDKKSEGTLITQTFFSLQMEFDATRIVLERHPNSSSLHNQMAILYLEKGMERSFMKEIQKAVEGEPENPINYFLLSVYYKEKGMIDKAIEECKKVIEKDTFNPSAYYLLGGLYERKGLLKDSLSAYQKAKKYLPKEEITYYDSFGGAYGLNFRFIIDEDIKRVKEKLNKSN
jgi:tetratricopeptide (TPR) repeat protein